MPEQRRCGCGDDVVHAPHRTLVVGPSIKYVTLFWTNFNPSLFVTLCHKSRDPLKYAKHLGHPIFSSTCIHTLCPYRGFVLVCWVLVRRICPGSYCPPLFLLE